MNCGVEYEWRLDSPDFGFEDLTYRQVLERYRGCYLPVEEPISLSNYRDIYHEYGIMPKMLDQEADPMFYVDDWARSDANSAKAYHYLYGLDYLGMIMKKVCGPVILLFWKTQIRRAIISVLSQKIPYLPAFCKHGL